MMQATENETSLVDDVFHFGDPDNDDRDVYDDDDFEFELDELDTVLDADEFDEDEFVVD